MVKIIADREGRGARWKIFEFRLYYKSHTITFIGENGIKRSSKIKFFKSFETIPKLL